VHAPHATGHDVVVPGASGAAGVPAGAVWAHMASPTPAAPEADQATAVDEAPARDLPWDVIVWDDPVTLMAYVVWVFQRVLGVTRDVATKLMLEVHTTGKSLVASEPREKAEFLLQQLHAHGLQATIEQQG
jgi:ATP-dependent Clp protease adaptor protein ClpS